MQSVRLTQASNVDEWRTHARRLLAAGIAPESVTWTSGDDCGLFDTIEPQIGDPSGATTQRVPRDFLLLAEAVLAHSDPQRFALAYRLLWRLTHGEPQLLKLITDDDTARARTMEKSVRRDTHKMKAFVRFREVPVTKGTSVFIAWFEPEHFIVDRVAPFFMRRFAGMHWSILTPYRSVHWDGEQLVFAPGAYKSDAPAEDALEDLWRTYYANIFNPARLKVQAMKSEMPVKYWKNLPEARLIPGLIREAMPRAQEMVQKNPTTPRKRMADAARPQAVPEAIQQAGSLEEVQALARECRRCDLWKPATQTVFGEGPQRARIMFIGEQPGDQEDLAGKPFVGPAGKLLDRALAEAGVDRSEIYVTNTVKHFKFEPRGKMRLHKRADSREQAACRPWLDAELDKVQPQIVVCLGAMAAQAMFGSGFGLLKERGQWRTLANGTRAFATVHPSYLLRLPDEDARRRGFADFVQDLKLLNSDSRMDL